ncbi:MAG: hypothetical protein HY692_07315, partial [Cyanobacteria bacterium NC_groundwater_1444_Ag_S-0.65um_54_12]|nr:hypothetical protein [Cyanobacteria bacterium NC_groundwater_1444_Ag_S-0.65um_54_12]
TKIYGAATLTAEFPQSFTSTTKFGSLAMDSLASLKGFAGHWGDGIIGSGLKEPSANETRSDEFTNRDQMLASKLTYKNLSAAMGLNSTLVSGYLGWDFGLGNCNIIADIDHDSIGGVVIDKPRAYSAAASLNLGSEILGVTLQGGLKGSGNLPDGSFQPLAAIQVVWNLNGIELSAGTSFRTGAEKANPPQELQPAAYVFIPALRPGLPKFLVGLTEPITISGKGGEGSLMEGKAGWTIQLDWDNPVLPKLVIEASLQQDVLFGSNYDGWAYAITSGVDF